MATETRDAAVRWHRSPDVAHRVVDEEAVLVDLRNGHYFGLNETGTVVWERLGDDGATVDDLVLALTGAFDVEESVARADIGALLDEMAGRDIVERGPAAGSGA